MKKNILSFALCLAIAVQSIAQDTQNNAVKLNLGGLLVGQIDLQYERVIKSNTTAQLTLGIMPGSDYKADLQSRLNASTLNNVLVSSAKLSGFQLVPEYRIYTGGTALKGFYVAPQLVFSSYKLAVIGTHDSGTATDKGEFNFTSIGAGCQIGWHWVVKDNISIDWQIGSIGLSSASAEASGTTSQWVYKEDLQQAAYNANYYLQKETRLEPVKAMTVKSNGSNGFTASGAAAMLYWRVGFALGYRF